MTRLRPGFRVSGETDDRPREERSDARTVNNAVRHTYRVLSDEEKAQMVKIKNAGKALIDIINETGKSRELSLALTNAEQAVMWAVKHVTA
jgi:hypothetical protein